MIAAMSKLTFRFLSSIILFGLGSCGGQSESSKPPETPTSDVDVKFHEPEAAEPAEATPSEAESPKPEAAKPESPPAAGTSGTNQQANAPKKGCAGLKKDVCEITLGCAWSTKKVCVDQ